MAVTKHKQQFPDFRLRPLPISDGHLLQLLQFRCSKVINLSGLYEKLVDVLRHTEFVMTNGIRFSLVNVYCPFNGFSHGSEVPPAPELIPSNCRIVFTFALSSDHFYAGKQVTLVSKRSTYHKIWSTDKHPKFVTIGIDNAHDQQFGFQQITSREMEFIYNMIGCFTKVWALDPDVEVSDTLWINSQRYCKRPLMDMLTEPFAALSYNDNVWRYLPGAVQLNPYVAYHAIAKFHMHFSSGNVADIHHSLKDQLNKYVADSLLWMVQYVNQKDSSTWDVQHMLAPALIVARLTGTQLPVDADFITELRETTENLFSSFHTNALEISTVLSPVDKAAELLINNDQKFNTWLLRILG